MAKFRADRAKRAAAAAAKAAGATQGVDSGVEGGPTAKHVHACRRCGCCLWLNIAQASTDYSSLNFAHLRSSHLLLAGEFLPAVPERKKKEKEKKCAKTERLNDLCAHNS